MGLGSMVGTGVFVSIGVAAGVAGSAVLPAIALAAFVALCNALSSAQLAAAHPVSGGTYEYGYLYLRPWLGFSAGWMFLCAKSASAATAALGVSGYLLNAMGVQGSRNLLASALSLGMTLLVAGGIRRSHRVNMVIVILTLAALGTFVVAGWPATSPEWRSFLPQRGFGEACALMFVAYTGYGRIATMGEEVRDPRRTIPRAILAVMLISAVLYGGVAFVALGTAGAETLSEVTRSHGAPLEALLHLRGRPVAAQVVALGAVTAMSGVLLNLILGLSRVLLAMGRRGDMPRCFAAVKEGNPRRAVLGVGAFVTLLAALGSLSLAWSFSAFTVLVYYAITNLAALRLPSEHRIYPRVFAWIGLAACLFLAFHVDMRVWIPGSVLLALGLGLRASFRLRAGPRKAEGPPHAGLEQRHCPESTEPAEQKH
jgi:APA family basic amino acid/polyamine antiporter